MSNNQSTKKEPNTKIQSLNEDQSVTNTWKNVKKAQSAVNEVKKSILKGN